MQSLNSLAESKSLTKVNSKRIYLKYFDLYRMYIYATEADFAYIY